jgi:hypothetical protein
MQWASRASRSTDPWRPFIEVPPQVSHSPTVLSTRSLRPSLVAQAVAGLVGLTAIGGCGDSDNPRLVAGRGGQDHGGASAEAGSGGVGGSTSVGGVINSTAGSNAAGAGGNANVQGGNQAAGGTGGEVATGGTSVSGGGSGGAVSDPCASGAPPSGADCCPNDPDKTQPGQCGCGNPDENECLIHRYSFEASVGGVVEDLVGDAPATVVKGSVSGGAANIAGFNSEEYVALESGLISRLSSATFETWVTWDGAAGDWQRIWDFGNSTSGPGNQGAEGLTYLFLTPRAGQGGLRLAYSLDSYRAETRVDGVHPMPINQQTHIAVVVDAANTKLLLYLEGQLEGASDWYGALGHLHDENNWLGRSQFLADPELGGKVHELRIYAAPRTATQILESYEAGPDVLPNEDGAGGAGGETSGGAGGETAGGAGGEITAGGAGDMPGTSGAGGAGG